MATTYHLPFDGRIRIASYRRFVLVRWLPGAESRPFIVSRSSTLSTLQAEYSTETDYIIDQDNRTVRFHFNGKEEIHNA